MKESPCAVTRALAQPHIVQSICDNLPEESLAAAAQANRQFFTLATEAKWTQAPLWVFRQRVQPSRRQIYASKIRHLDFYETEAARHHAHFRGLAFDGLKSLNVSDYEPQETRDTHEVLKRYLTPALERLDLAHGVFDRSLFRLLRSKCNHLRRLRISSNEVDLPSADIAALMSACPYLEQLHILQFNINSLDKVLAVQCARQPKLRFLQLASIMEVKQEAFDAIESKVFAPFAALDRVMMSVPSAAISLLGKWCTNVFEIWLSVSSSDASILAPLANMKKLRRLCLQCPAEYAFAKSEIMSLCALPELDDINLTSNEGTDGTRAKFHLSTAEFSYWISHFPRLKGFEMQLQVPEKYDAALTALATSCRDLRLCTWPAEVNFSELELESKPDALFPSLLQLCLPSAVTSSSDTSFPNNLSEDSLAHVLRKHFPVLRHPMIGQRRQEDDSGVYRIKSALQIGRFMWDC